ncbi:MAG TPA: hypothetical protein VJ873_01665, partial [bacterium]|nr:hypothetical protein [bacterium]
MKDSSAPPKGPSSFPWEFSPWIYAFGSALLAALFHLPGLKNGFVGWDDPEVVVNNPHIHLLDPSFFQWAFTSFRHQNWMPLTWLSYAIDYAVGGNQPGIYHFTAILFHAINTALVFYLCLRILQVSRQKAEAAGAVGWGIPPIPVAFLAAVLFGLHPLQVESVAWVSERNNLLFVLFYLWALLSYLDYASSTQPGKGKLYRCLALFLLALMSKAIAVTLPLAMLILDAWPLRRLQGRLGRMVWEKTAFFAASVLAGVMAIFAQASGKAFEMTEGFPFYFRVLNAFRSLALYLWKILWPVDLCPLYPFPHVRDAAYFAGDAAAAGVVLL